MEAGEEVIDGYIAACVVAERVKYNPLFKKALIKFGFLDHEVDTLLSVRGNSGMTEDLGIAKQHYIEWEAVMKKIDEELAASDLSFDDPPRKRFSLPGFRKGGKKGGKK